MLTFSFLLPSYPVTGFISMPMKEPVVSNSPITGHPLKNIYRMPMAPVTGGTITDPVLVTALN